MGTPDENLEQSSLQPETQVDNEELKKGVRATIGRLFKCHPRAEAAVEVIMKQVEGVIKGTRDGIRGLKIGKAALLTALALEKTAKNESRQVGDAVEEAFYEILGKRLEQGRLPKACDLDDEEVRDSIEEFVGSITMRLSW